MVRCLYVFVEISVDVQHLCACVAATVSAPATIAVMGTIQFAGAVHEARKRLAAELEASGSSQVTVPQIKPLSLLTVRSSILYATGGLYSGIG